MTDQTPVNASNYTYDHDTAMQLAEPCGETPSMYEQRKNANSQLSGSVLTYERAKNANSQLTGSVLTNANRNIMSFDEQINSPTYMVNQVLVDYNH